MVVLRTGGRRRILAIALVLIVVSAGAILGQRTGRFSQASRNKAGPAQETGITPASFDSPAKEYIYAGGKLIATEEPQPSTTGPGSSTPGLYDPVNSAFFLKNANSTGVADLSFLYGPPGDI